MPQEKTNRNSGKKCYCFNTQNHNIQGFFKEVARKKQHAFTSICKQCQIKANFSVKCIRLKPTQKSAGGSSNVDVTSQPTSLTPVAAIALMIPQPLRTQETSIKAVLNHQRTHSNELELLGTCSPFLFSN